jgi:hypothetical protein
VPTIILNSNQKTNLTKAIIRLTIIIDLNSTTIENVGDLSQSGCRRFKANSIGCGRAIDNESRVERNIVPNNQFSLIFITFN